MDALLVAVVVLDFVEEPEVEVVECADGWELPEGWEVEPVLSGAAFEEGGALPRRRDGRLGSSSFADSEESSDEACAA